MHAGQTCPGIYSNALFSFYLSLNPLALFSRQTLLLLEGLVNEVVELLVSRLEVVVDNDEVVDAWRLGVLELLVGLGEALLDAGLGLGAAASQALLELLDRGRRDEDVAGGDARVFDLLDALPESCQP